MSLIRLNGVSKSYESQAIIKDVHFRLEKGDRVGLIGKNGTGKTTVLRLMLEQVPPDGGVVEIETNLNIGYFSQFSELTGSDSVRDVLNVVFADITALETELAGIDAAFGEANADLDSLVSRQAELLEAMEHSGGWTYQTRIETVLSKLGFSQDNQVREIDQLSGGWRNRAALAKLLLQEPDVLLMDEPTNFLDVDGVEWLEGWLSGFRGALVVVSHDRNFLDNVVTQVIEVENYHFQEYSGNFSNYIQEKQFRFKTLAKQFQHEEELLALESEAIKRRVDAANPGKSLKRKMANIKKRAGPRPVDQVITSIYGNLHVAQKLCEVKSISKAYDGDTLFDNLTFSIGRGDRLAILGANGCGKSTLLRVLNGSEDSDTGSVAWARGGDFIDFNATLAALDPKDTVTHAVNVVGMAFDSSRKKVNRFLSLLQFSEMDLQKRIGTLSGGQQARVALAQCLLSGTAVVVLDEPTNHLDLTSTQVMERALVNFPGAVIVVSHDRFFVDKVANRLLVFDGGEVTGFNGNWTQWQVARRG